MREAYQHGWCDRLKYECRIDNAGTAAGMIACAKDHPHLIVARWQWLLATDGLRVDPWEHQGRPEDSHEWNELRQRWEAEQGKRHAKCLWKIRRLSGRVRVWRGRG
jgi:hypothetical protein